MQMIEMERKELASVEAAAGRQRIADMYEVRNGFIEYFPSGVLWKVS